MESSIRRTLADDGTATVSVSGEIDFSNAEELAQVICETAADDATSMVRVDLHDAAFIDSTGLGALIEGYRAATDAGAAFVVVDPTPGFRRVLTVTGLGELFGLGDTVARVEPAQATGT